MLKIAGHRTLFAVAVFVVAVFFAGAPATTFANNKPVEPLKIEDALGAFLLANDAPVTLSPDGEWVAYTVKDDRKRETPSDPRFTLYTQTGAYEEALGCDIWITNTRTGESRNLTQSKGTNWTPVWSPDGKYLVFYSDRDGTAHLWLWERATGQLRDVPNAIVRPFFNSQAPRWSPDSRSILFKVLPEGMTVEQAADLIAGPATEPETKAVAKSSVTAKVYTFVPPGKEQKQADAKKVLNATGPDAWMDRYLADLAIFDVTTGLLTRPVKRRRPMAYSFSPDGKNFAYTHFKAVPANTQQIIYELSVVRAADGAERVIIPEMYEMDGYFSWSPDSKHLAFVTSGTETKADCVVVSVDGGESVNLTKGDHPRFAPSVGEDQRLPVWDADGKNLYLYSPRTYGREGSNKLWKVSFPQGKLTDFSTIPDREVLHILGPITGGPLWTPDGGKSMVVLTQHQSTKQVGFFRVDLATGAPSELFERAIHVRDELMTTDVARNGQVSFVAQDVTHPEDVYLLSPDLRNPRKLTSLNPQLETLSMGTSRTVTWHDLDGRQLHGALLLPSDYREGRKYPLIVNVYGGAHLSNSVDRFGFFGAGSDNMQILATRGYAVLIPDAPLDKGTPMLDLLKTVMPGVNKVVELGIADPERLGLMGHSYGGYSTLALITQTKVFKAAMASAGISDLISIYGSLTDNGFSHSTGWAEAGQGGMVGHPWEFRERYIENSPIFYLDRVQTPLLLIHSAGDDAVPAAQSEEVFVALRRLGKEVTYVKYGGETHWEGLWGSPNVADYWNRVISWFDDHLKS